MIAIPHLLLIAKRERKFLMEKDTILFFLL